MLAGVNVEKRVREQVREIADELDTITLGRPRGVVHVLPRIRELLELEAVLVYSVRNPAGRWEVDRWEADGLVADALPLAINMFRTAPEFPLYYNPLAPVPGQRNRVIDALQWIHEHKPGTWDESPMCEHVLRPLGTHRYSQPRALLYRGSTLLGWFGGMDPHKPTARQMQLLTMLVDPMRRRLAAEDQLGATHVQPALDAALDRIGAPAFLVTAKCKVVEANRSGYAELARDRESVIGAVRDALAGRPSTLELSEIADVDGTQMWLAVKAISSADARIRACVDQCRTRWGLTPRQAEVLMLVTRGLSNAAISQQLGCVERTVELHLTALFDRAGVDGRAALVASVLTVIA